SKIRTADHCRRGLGWHRIVACAQSPGEWTMGAKIIDRGRRPEIEGTRITIYDVLDYLQEGWRYDQIAGLVRLPTDDMQAAIAYQATLARSRQKVQAKLAEIRARCQPEDTYASNHGGP